MNMEKFLSTVKVFSKLDQDKLRMLSDHVQVHNFSKDMIIVEQGVPGEYLWIIRQGSVQISREIKGKGKKVLATLSPPDIFGEISLISKKPTNAEVRADEPTVVLRIPGEVVASVIKRNLSANAAFSKTTIERLTENARKMFHKG
ncbi:MAG: cyclic nucleotide-binding domain-containing protein [Desulfobulbaceae bacterium]